MIYLLALICPGFVLFIIWFLECFLGCEMDDCMGGYDEFTVWERIKMKFKTPK
jgi:hypothetical protein